MLDALIAEFGDNAGLAQELYAQYRHDPASVDESWRRVFERIARADAPPRGAAPAIRSAPPVPAAPRPPAAAPTLRMGEQVVPITGGAATIARNMEASLSVPTATSYRSIPAKVMEENRRVLNRHREVVGQSKVSFTHLVAWAIVKALGKHPSMNDAYGEIDGRPLRMRRSGVHLGIAVDVTRRDGSRTLLVPNIKNAEKLDFAGFLAAFDTLVAKSRKGTLEPDAFAGTSISLTNPGTVGTTASAPRLMPGQGTIIATGSMGYPAEFQAMPPEVMANLGVARVMMVSSTYDHRIIQGAESGAFLATLEQLLLGQERFYEQLFEDLKVPYRPVQWEVDTSPPSLGGGTGLELVAKEARVVQLINAYRVRGHLIADLDPLGGEELPYHPDLDPHTYGFTIWDLDRRFIASNLGNAATDSRETTTLREVLEVLRQTYCGKIGAEYMYNQDPVAKSWLMERMESCRNRAPLTEDDRRRILAKLVEAESFEKFLHTKYVGHKRFSLEGGEAAIPLLTRLLDRAAGFSIEEAVLGMPHRGRLTVLTTIVGKPVDRIFAEFEEVEDVESIQGSGDVKYHLGAVGSHDGPAGSLRVSLAPNPSHLEAVDPVVEGIVRAKQERLGDAVAHAKVLPVLLHGDGAFAGQGVVAETLNMSMLHGYRTGGTVHVVVNNQIGFTTTAQDARSSQYCTDIAKMVQAPIFHVNGDDPEAVVHVVDVAMEYRMKFRRDVVIDMVCYRRYGHNEGDEPSYTQPLLYQKIKQKTSVARLYGEALAREGKLAREEVDKTWADARAALDRAFEDSQRTRSGFTDSLVVPPPSRLQPPGDAMARLQQIVRGVSTVPEGFEVHPKLRPLLKRRSDYASGRPEIDWAGAETLAFGMYLLEGIPVRLSGQDSGRGTFSQRHSVLADVKTGAELVPLNHISKQQAAFEVIDSLLSENAVMGFEFGYSVADPHALVLWEAQFGDFMNGAQVVIDQFIVGSEQKWNQRCSLVLLLPHGQEGQGPEHSSARLERFLTLCAEENLRVVNPSTPAQYYHALRRQLEGDLRKPLVAMTPKSLLRHPKAVSSIRDLAEGVWQPVLDDDLFGGGAPRDGVRRLVFANGKVVYDLLAGREKSGRSDVAVIRLEQLYPFPGAELGRVVAQYPRDAELVFVQEEPRNMGAWRFVREQFLDGKVEGVGGDRPLRYIGRRELASPAPGSHRVFQQEQDAMVAEAMRLSQAGGSADAAPPNPPAARAAAVAS